MKIMNIITQSTLLFGALSLAAASSVNAATDEEDLERSQRLAMETPYEPAAEITKAVAVLIEQMEAPAEKRISKKLLDAAQCLVIIPEMLQGGVGFGIKHGNGMMACRHDDTGTWGVPAFIRLSGASVGAQLGVQKLAVVMLAMTDNGLNQLLSGKPVVSGEAGVSVGPVGRNAEIAMDVLMQTPLLSYTRSEGFYAGATMGGSLFTTAKKVNKELYGEYGKARDLLLTPREVPATVKPLVDALNIYAPDS